MVGTFLEGGGGGGGRDVTRGWRLAGSGRDAGGQDEDRRQVLRLTAGGGRVEQTRVDNVTAAAALTRRDGCSFFFNVHARRQEVTVAAAAEETRSKKHRARFLIFFFSDRANAYNTNVYVFKYSTVRPSR